MTVALIIPDRDLAPLVNALRQAKIVVETWPEVSSESSLAVVWNPPVGAVRDTPGVRAIVAFGAGVDQLLSDPSIPSDLPIGRIAGPQLGRDITRYTLGAILSLERQFDFYRSCQDALEWKPESQHKRSAVGVLGYGSVGRQICQAASDFGFTTRAWRQNDCVSDAAEICVGDAGLEQLLRASDYVVNTLPLTTQTAGLLNYQLLRQFKSQAWLLNVGRGATMVEADLIRALDDECLAGAWLDVFEQEPLPTQHPFWRHRKVRITPHIAGLTDPVAAAQQIIESYRQVQQGHPPLNLVDRKKGY